MASSAMTLSVVATGQSSLAGVHVGTSGWSYPSWKPDFYPAGTDAKEFLSFYAQRFSTVELNTTGYRLPAEEQFRRWAEQTPAGRRPRPRPGAPLRLGAPPPPAVLGREPPGSGRTAGRCEGAAVRLLPSRGRAHGAALCGATDRATALVRAALPVDSANGVEQGVLLPLVGCVRGVVAIVVMESGDDDAHVRSDAWADRCEPVLCAVARTA